jgi:aldehyde decarbonylase
VLCRDDQIILSAILFYLGAVHLPGGQHLPLWRTDGAVLIALLHAGPVELIYYWFHRALHHHFLYTRYHSHHHASIVTEPITCTYQYHVISTVSLCACLRLFTPARSTYNHVCSSTVYALFYSALN